jgi:hypothetical protein
MTGDDRHVLANSEALAELETAIARFAGQGLEKARRAETEVRRARENLEARRNDLRREIRGINEQITEAHDDTDTSVLERRLERAMEELGLLRKRLHDLEVAADRFTIARVRFDALNGDISQAARSSLRKTLSDLHAYVALKKNVLGAAGPSGLVSDPPAPPSDVGSHCFDPTSFALPPGYQWIPLAEIETERELAGVQLESSFTKGVSYQDMLRGFDLLRRDILPVLNDPANRANSDTFADMDEVAGVTEPSGKLRIYRAFFGDDPIYVQRGQPGERFTVSSGRHRIKVAMDLRWTAVPGKTGKAVQG